MHVCGQSRGKVPQGGYSRLAFWGTTIINVPRAYCYTSIQTHTHRQTASVFVCALVFYWLVLFTVSIGVVYRGHSVSFCCWERNRFCIWTKARDCCVIANLLILWQHNSWEQDFKWAQYSYIALLSYKKNIYIYIQRQKWSRGMFYSEISSQTKMMDSRFKEAL